MLESTLVSCLLILNDAKIIKNNKYCINFNVSNGPAFFRAPQNITKIPKNLQVLKQSTVAGSFQGLEEIYLSVIISHFELKFYISWLIRRWQKNDENFIMLD